MAIITIDMIISRETDKLLFLIQFKLIKHFQPEIGKTKFDQVILESI